MVEGPLGWSQGAHAALCGELNTEETEGRFPGVLGNIMDSLVTQMIKNLPTMQETRVQSLDQEEPLEKEMATHSSNFALEITWTEKPGGLQSIGSQRIRHYLTTKHQ